MFKWIQKKINQRKIKNENIKNAVNKMISYCEGNISHKDFFSLALSNEYIQELIINDKKATKNVKEFNKKTLFSLNSNKIYDRLELFRLTANYFRRRKIKLKFYNPDVELYDFIYKICPKYCSFVDDDNFLKFFLKEYLNNEINIKKGKQIVKELFICKKYAPRWLQNPEWPIINNKPCIFLYQTGFPNRHDYIEYFFKDHVNNQIIKVIQYD